MAASPDHASRPRLTTLARAASYMLPACVVTSCLADLPPPAACPAPATSSATSCAADLDALNAVGRPCMDGVVTAVACMPSTSCETCAADAIGCQPAPACPPPVTRTAGASARCARLVSEREGLAGSCNPCARNQCAALCDGRGPVFAYSSAAMRTRNTNLVEGDATPPSGAKVGVYARMRGHGSVSLIARIGMAPLITEPMTVDSTEFADFVTTGSATGKGVPIAFTVSTIDQMGAIVEIDCLVPFWSGP